VLVVLGLAAAACVLRFPAHDMPLNRDEATYALIADQGSLDLLPYRDLFDNKQPLIYAVYWVLAQLAPQATGAVRLTAALAAGAAALALMALLAPRIGRARAVAAAATAVVAGSSTYVEGYDLNAEHLLILTGTLTVLLAVRLGPSRRRLAPLLVGLLCGVAVLTKAVFVLSVPALLIPLLAGRAARGQSAATTVGLLAAGAAAGPLAAYAAFAALGAGGWFWEGNVAWNLRYIASAEGRVGLTARVLPLAVLAAAALAAGLVRLWRPSGRDVLTATLVAWLLGACAGAIAGGREFPHYYAPIVPPACALLWLPWVPAARAGPRRAALAAVPVVLAIAVAIPFARDVAKGFSGGGRELAERQFGAVTAGVWGQQYDIGRRLRRIARPGDELFVTGAEPGFNLYSGLAPPSRYFFVYDYPAAPAAAMADIRRTVCGDRPPRFVVMPYGRPLEDGCVAPGRYRELLSRELPAGWRLSVLELARPG